MLFSLRGIIIASGVGLLAKQYIDLTDELSLVRARLKIVTDSAEELNAVQKQLFRTANETRSAYKGVAGLYARLARSTKETSFTQEDLLETTRLINKAIIVSGASATEAGAALIQLSQGLAAGALRGEEFNSVVEQTPRLAEAMAAGLGVGVGQLREMAKAGQLTTERVIKALLSQRAAVEREFAQMPVTVGQAFTVLGNVIGFAVTDLNEGLGATEALAGSIITLSDVLHALVTSGVIKDIGTGFREVFNILMAFPRGVIDFFRDIGAAARMTAEDIERVGDALLAIEPPPPTPWQKFWAFMNQLSFNFFEIIKAGFASVGEAFASVVVSMWDLVSGAAGALWHFSGVVERALMFDWTGVRDNYKKMIDSLKNLNQDLTDNVDQAADSIVEIWRKAYNKMMGIEPGVGVVTKLMPPLPEEKPKVAPPPIKAPVGPTELEKIRAELEALQDVIDAGGTAALEQSKAWELYKDARLRQIAEERKELEKLGLSSELIVAWIGQAVSGVPGEFAEVFGIVTRQIDDLVNSLRPLEDAISARRIAAEVSATRELFEQLAESGEATTEQLNAAWARYVMYRKAQIEEERKALLKLGVAADVVEDLITARLAEISKGFEDIRKDEKEAWEEWGDEVANALKFTFSDTLFKALKGEFEGFFDFISDLTDSFLRLLSQKMSETLFTGLGGILSPAGGGGGASPFAQGQSFFGYLGSLFGLQKGAVVTRPTLAMIAEGGIPEAVIPLDRAALPFNVINIVTMLAEGRTREAIASIESPGSIIGLQEGAIVTKPTLAMIAEGGTPEAVIPLPRFEKGEEYPRRDERPVEVKMFIQTPDVQSFRASQGQIMGQAKLALQQRGGRNL